MDEFELKQAKYRLLIDHPLVEWLTKQRDYKLREAEKAATPEAAFALLKEAGALTFVLTHIASMASVGSKPEA